ncbi:guanine deaminase [Corynebacterium glyciniphilum]|uniref:guanine deaminase n=1 Tax=Corynebacterium glyciniphilum TaxID=1404244 RepID=UPI00264B6A7B|nr:guanine deaminase [Corynebacterium glyciniphilum]MDN5682669.1 guanine deaminase [Corynebacterium glyciniphilum]MDN6705014.1 guanine deaminase [Corynebacterium glyciniphilum]
MTAGTRPTVVLGHVVTPTTSGTDGLLDIPSGAVAHTDGTILDVGDVQDVLARYPGALVEDHGDRFIVPGFVDAHVHYPQIGMIASPGLELLDWLERFTFPAEARFADDIHADRVADFFTDQLVDNGVTTACVYATVHPGSAEALFRQAQRKNLRVITGKVCMDRNAPDDLLDTPSSAVEDSVALLERWHGVGRLEYAITPRFAPTSSDAQLTALGELAASYPDVVVQTHLSENTAEIEQVRSLFPGTHDYTDVYDRAGLVRRRSVFGHGVHLSDRELRRLGQAEASVAHCPTSNFFLGSGMFGVARAQSVADLRVGLGSDVGAGTSLSPLVTLGSAYQASRMLGAPLDVGRLLRLATLGGAEALGVAESVGSLEAGKDADLVVLDPAGPQNPALLRNRVDGAETLEEILFATMVLGDERAVSRTVVAGV